MLCVGMMSMPLEWVLCIAVHRDDEHAIHHNEHQNDHDDLASQRTKPLQCPIEELYVKTRSFMNRQHSAGMV